MILHGIKPVNFKGNKMGFVQCSMRQFRKIDQRFCMVCDKKKCEEKSNLLDIRVAKNERMLKMIESNRRYR